LSIKWIYNGSNMDPVRLMRMVASESSKSCQIADKDWIDFQ